MGAYPLRDSDGASPAGVPSGEDLAGEVVSALGEHAAAAEIFVRLLAMCLPANTPYRGGRRWKAGYNRMVAIVYLVAPEMFLGLTQDEVAAEIGLKRRQFVYLLEQTRTELAARAKPRPAPPSAPSA